MMRVFIILALAVVWLAQPARAQTPARFCARVGTDDTLRPIPPALVPQVNAVFHMRMPAHLTQESTVWRCFHGRVLVCNTGANLPCGKADTRRTSPGGAGWCRAHPDADFIPLYMTGHDSIYQWRCRAGHPAIVRQTSRVDPRGFVARYWRTLGKPLSPSAQPPSSPGGSAPP